MAKTILITGASSGLGLATARALAQAGHRVFAGARSFAAQADGGAQEPFHRLRLDVTDGESVAAVVEEVIRQAGAIDVLIHCAARIVLGSCEETGLEELRAVLETNYLGIVAVTQAALPHMRARGSGLIMPFSSINGLLATPYTGAYVASKHAVEGWAECLRMEVAPFGIGVCVIRPGDHRSGSEASRLRAAGWGSRGEAYASAAARGTAKIAHDEAHGADPEKLARRIVRIVNAKRPPTVCTVARIDQRAAIWLHDTIPMRMFSRILRSYYVGRDVRSRRKAYTDDEG